ncbi:MAG TPA: NUDIX hydrolase [Steroidobacteraceae bacterium]|nr:NUDIX hydrolase [Steroidobacteraceae bacterium]
MKQISTVFAGRVITVCKERVQLPNGNEADYEVVHHPGGAAVVALDDANRVCLLHQYRPAAGGWVWELPAGRLEPGEPPAQTARRELVEEAGREAAQWQDLGTVLSSPGVFDERIHLYLARQLTTVPMHHEPFEVLEVHWVDLPVALERALNGEIADSKTIAGLLRAAARLGMGLKPMET